MRKGMSKKKFSRETRFEFEKRDSILGGFSDSHSFEMRRERHQLTTYIILDPSINSRNGRLRFTTLIFILQNELCYRTETDGTRQLTRRFEPTKGRGINQNSAPGPDGE